MNADITHYQRFLAKIGHSYCSAVLGLDAFRPFLQRRILHPSADLSEYVGSLPDIPPREDTVIRISAGVALTPSKKKVVYCRLRLMGFLKTPEYVIAVGRYTAENFDTVGFIDIKPIVSQMLDASGRLIGLHGTYLSYVASMDTKSMETRMMISVQIFRHGSPLLEGGQ
jgi:hypothetical protein